MKITQLVVEANKKIIFLRKNRKKDFTIIAFQGIGIVRRVEDRRYTRHFGLSVRSVRIR